MKQIIFSLLLCSGLFIAQAQQTEPTQPGQTQPTQTQPTQTQQGRPINPATDQKQNINEMAWDNTSMTVVQMTDVPSTVSSSFKTKYPNQGNVTWYKYQNGYIASYNDPGNMSQRIVYDMKGNPIYMGRQVQNTSLPASTRTYLKSKYPDVTYDNIYEVTTPAGETSYQVLINGRWMQFDKSGNLVPAK